jgi:hypothetical protein
MTSAEDHNLDSGIPPEAPPVDNVPELLDDSSSDYDSKTIRAPIANTSAITINAESLPPLPYSTIHLRPLPEIPSIKEIYYLSNEKRNPNNALQRLQLKIHNEQLLLAAARGNATRVWRYLHYDARVNTTTKQGFTALHLAAARLHDTTASIATNLSFGADVNAKRTTGDTASHAAATVGDHRTVQLLLNYGASIHNQNYTGETPLLSAAKLCGSFPKSVPILEKTPSLRESNFQRVMRTMLEAGTNANVRNTSGWSTLDYLSRSLEELRADDFLTLVTAKVTLDQSPGLWKRFTDLVIQQSFSGIMVTSMMLWVKKDSDRIR